MNPENFHLLTIMKTSSNLYRRLGKLAAISGLLAAGAISAQAASMQTYLNACSYTTISGGGSISGSASIASASCNSFDETWENHWNNPITWSLSVAGTGTHPITSSDVNYFGTAAYSLTWPASNWTIQNENFSISCTNTALDYDKTGTLSVGTDCTPDLGCGTSSVTIYNMGSVMNAAIVSSGAYYPSWWITRGEGSQNITLRFIRGDTLNPRTVSFTVSGNAVLGVDYTVSPALTNSATMNAGSSNVDFTITVLAKTNIVGTKTLSVSLQPGYYQIGNTNATISILQDVPIISVAATSPCDSQNNYFQGQFTITRSGGLSNVLTANLAVGGTATAGSDYVSLPTAVTFAVNQTSTNLFVSALNANLAVAKTIVLSLVSSSTYFQGVSTNATVTLLPNGSTTNSVSSPTGMYWRGSGSDPTY